MMPSSRSYSTQSLSAMSGSGTGSARSNSKAVLEIIPESRFIVFHGGEHEAAAAKLRGVVRLTTPDAMTISRPRVRLEGKRKIAWWYPTGLGTGEIADKRVFWNEEQKLGVESAHKIKAGVMEWPFEFDLAPAMPESVEGLRDSYIAYHIHASVARPGWNARALFAQEHIRIVRTLGRDAMATTRTRVNADIWANKIAYSISIPTDAIVFGTSITADVELSPIRKGLRMGKVQLRLMETLVRRIQVSDQPDARFDRAKTDEFEVAKEELDFPENTKVMYEDESTEEPVLADEMYKFKATLPLPKSLNHCRQDVDSHPISITHRFKLLVNIHNPEGHMSQLVCKLPIKLFISPNLPVDESNNVQGITGMTDEALNNAEDTVGAPPQYGQHQLDQIFSGVDTAGYLSHPGSGPVTPAGWSARSRRASNENLASLNGMAELSTSDEPRAFTSSSPTNNYGSATPSILRSRLAALQERSVTTQYSRTPPGVVSFALSTTHSPHPERADISSSDPRASTSLPSTTASYFPSISHGNSTGHSSHNTSTAPTPPILESADETAASDYNMTDLTRVPSYGAALRTSGAVTPYTEGPPSYIEATSRPPSPTTLANAAAAASSSSPLAHSPPSASGLQRPSRAHVRNGGGSPAAGAANSGPGAGLGGGVDNEVRVRLLRAQT